MEDERWLMMGVLDHLQNVIKRGDLKEEPLQEAIFAISNAYSLNIHNSATRERYPLDGLSLPEVFKAGRAQLLADKPAAASASAEKSPANNQGTSAMDVEKPSVASDDPGFTKFVARLKETTSFFSGVEEGSPEYERRLSRAREKYDSKRKEKKQKLANESPSKPSASREADKAKAEELKLEGNIELKAKNYQKAHDLYTKCIELDSDNAVYYSNRAAAKLHLSLYREAVQDCKRAMELDPEFVRPRERLGLAYRHLGMTQKEVEALKGAVRAAPHNESLVAQLRDAEARLAGGERGMPGAGVGANAGGGMGASGAGGAMESLLSNLSANPSALGNMSRAMGLNLPDGTLESFMNSETMSQMGNMVRENPAMVQQAMQAMMGMPGMADVMSGAMNANPSGNSSGNANGNGNCNSETNGGGQD